MLKNASYIVGENSIGEMIVDVTKLPDSYRYDYIRILVRGIYGDIKRVDYLHRIEHGDIITQILNSIIEEVIEKTAKNNPIEFVRYHKVLTDAQFATLFPTDSAYNAINRQKLIDILEDLTWYIETHENVKFAVDVKTLLSASEYQKIMAEKNERSGSNF